MPCCCPRTWKLSLASTFQFWPWCRDLSQSPVPASPVPWEQPGHGAAGIGAVGAAPKLSCPRKHPWDKNWDHRTDACGSIPASPPAPRQREGFSSLFPQTRLLGRAKALHLPKGQRLPGRRTASRAAAAAGTAAKHPQRSDTAGLCPSRWGETHIYVKRKVCCFPACGCLCCLS